MDKIWLKLQFGRAACTLVAVVLLFALSGSANATVIISWEFNNTPQTVGPTDTIDMMATVTTGSPGPGDPITIVSFDALVSSAGGTLFGPSNPYTIDLPNTGTFIPPIDIYGGTGTFLFGTLTPVGGVAPFGTFTSGLGDVLFTFSDAYVPLGTLSSNTFTINVVPEPSTMLLLGSGLAGLGFFKRRRKREA